MIFVDRHIDSCDTVARIDLRRFTGDDLEDIRIAGRVLACVHKV